MRIRPLMPRTCYLLCKWFRNGSISLTNTDLTAFLKSLWLCLVPITDGAACGITAGPTDRNQGLLRPGFPISQHLLLEQRWTHLVHKNGTFDLRGLNPSQRLYICIFRGEFLGEDGKNNSSNSLAQHRKMQNKGWTYRPRGLQKWNIHDGSTWSSSDSILAFVVLSAQQRSMERKVTWREN